MGRACGTYADVNERLWWGNLKERDHTLGLRWEDNIRITGLVSSASNVVMRLGSIQCEELLTGCWPVSCCMELVRYVCADG
jgi:hypothetical protein